MNGENHINIADVNALIYIRISNCFCFYHQANPEYIPLPHCLIKKISVRYDE